MSKSSPKNASMEDDQARTESDQTKSPLDVAIIGAGIGGLALAIGLLRQYVPYTLYEAAPQYSTIGAGVGVGPNVLRAMDMIDSRFRELYEDISTGNITPNKEHVMMDAMLTEEGFGAKQGYIATSYGAPTY
jgi:salicylate hydroxylase